MPKRKAKAKNDFSQISCRKGGRKLNQQKLEALPVYLPDDYREFLLAHNGGEPNKNAFRYPFEGIERVSTIDFFYAVRPYSNRPPPFDNLVYHGLLEHRNELPRWSIPIARVDEDSFVLIFEDGVYRKGVWYFCWRHDHGEPFPGQHVECEGAIEKIADSISDFVALLRSPLDFYSFVSFIVPSDISLSTIKRETKQNGMKWLERDGVMGKYATCGWDLLSEKTFLWTDLFLVNNDEIPATQFDLALPKLDVPRGTSVLHLMVSTTYKDLAIKKLPKKIGNWKLEPIEHDA